MPTVLGVVLVAAGFVLIAFTWGRVAGLTSVSLQLPYLVSGGLTGLGLILVGLTIVNIQAKRSDAAERARQMQQLGSALRDAMVTDEPSADALSTTGRQMGASPRRNRRRAS